MSVAKSRHQIATEIAKSYTREGTGYADRLYQLGYAIETALKERDERAAKIIESYVSHAPTVCHQAVNEIRNENANAL